jgi:hypothetical protein
MKSYSFKHFSLLFTFFLLTTGLTGWAQAVPVTIGKDDQGNWQLYRNGEPYYIKGVGGKEHLDVALEIGANSFRTWSPDDADEVLAIAEELDMTVMMGLWVGHERHGFDYNNEAKVQAQLEYFTSVVEKYKDHPNILLWGIGNEVDLFYSNTKVWDAIEDIAAMVKRIDPNHPTSTVTAGLDSREVKLIMEKAPSIDIYGINTYGDIGIVKDTIRAAGWEGPYIISEWGPTGHWEVAKTIWGAPVEQSSSEKAVSYRNRYKDYIASDREMCIGSYVFLWGQKQETTSTWYGMFSNEGYSSEAINVLEELWTGDIPANRAPGIEKVLLNGLKKGDSILLTADHLYEAEVFINDPDGDNLKYIWEVVKESQDTKAGGDAETRPPSVKGLGVKSKGNSVKFRAPADEGPYRLFFFAYDGNDHYAYTNVPFYVMPAGEDDKQGRPVTFKKRSL